MQENTINQKYHLTGFSDTALDTQSILDVFVLQDIIDPIDAEKLKASLHTNREVENFLLKNHLVSKDTINKAYSIILKVPFISLSNVQLPDEALAIIPKKVAIKFGLIPFDVKNGLVRLAVCKPADLLVNYSSGLKKIFENKNLAIEIFITGESDFNEVVKQFNKSKSSNLLLKTGSLPVIQLRNFDIPVKFIKKIPMEFIEKYRLVVFGENVMGDYLIACQNSDTVVTKKVLQYIEKTNKVKLEVYATSEEDIDYVIAHYGEQKNEPEIAPEKEEAPLIDKNKVVPEKENNKGQFNFSLDQLFKNPNNTAPGITIDSVRDSDVSAPVKTEKNAPKMESRVEISDETGETNSPSLHEYNKEPSESIDSDLMTQQNNKRFDPKMVSQKLSIQNIETETPKEPEINPEITDVPEKEVSDVPTPEQVASNEQKKISLGKNIMEAKDLGLLLNGDIKDEKELEAVVREGYIPKIVAAILSYALNKKVSDIHIEPQSKVLRIRIRIDGVLIDTIKMPLKLQPPITSRIKIISKLKIDETRIPQDGRFDVVLGNREVDVRVSTLPTVHGEKIVLRVLDKSQKILSLEDLGMQGTGFDKTIEAIAKPWGIILSTGPTGSGKSTTLNAIINRLNTPGVNISTLEDPVEYETPGVNQTQVKPEIGFTFAAGLRSLLRQDPNIIMVGEIRDGETAGMATHAALTGHLVLSTLHTNDTAGTLPRLINMGIEPFLITSSMNLVMAQRLIRKICPKCKEEIKLPQKLLDEVKEAISLMPKNNMKDIERIPKDFKFYYGRGCDECTQGYKGRVGLFEVMTMSSEIEDLAINKRPSDEIKQAAIRGGMITMKQDGIIKALQGITTIDEVLQATIDK